jgi:murein L,D-transpeptidase YafK
LRILLFSIFAFTLAALAFLAVGYYSKSNFWLETKDRLQRRISAVFPNYDPVDGAPARLAGRLERAGLAAGSPIFIRIFKEESQLEVWLEKDARYQLLHTYAICKWSGKLGPKLAEGDRQSPEGFYEVSPNQLNPNSRHHLSFNIGFPNAYDRSHGRTGSYLMVHGGCSSIGCYAVTDTYVDEIYSLVKTALDEGQKAVPVHIFPFRMSRKRLAKEQGNQWHPFWMELKQGYDLFETDYTLPAITQCDGHYRFAQTSEQKCQPIAS